MKLEVAQELVKLADSLDKRGMRKEADAIHNLIKSADVDKTGPLLVTVLNSLGELSQSLIELRESAKRDGDSSLETRSSRRVELCNKAIDLVKEIRTLKWTSEVPEPFRAKN